MIIVSILYCIPSLPATDRDCCLTTSIESNKVADGSYPNPQMYVPGTGGPFALRLLTGLFNWIPKCRFDDKWQSMPASAVMAMALP
ncbi:MAG: hypothetical protein DI535_22705 [Citrobacter freundii]|nr:MAG: hypothetical protein DI535_22705 [Citrobacter freundii]